MACVNLCYKVQLINSRTLYKFSVNSRSYFIQGSSWSISFGWFGSFILTHQGHKAWRFVDQYVTVSSKMLQVSTHTPPLSVSRISGLCTVHLHKKVNWGQLKSAKKMSLFGNNGGNCNLGQAKCSKLQRVRWEFGVLYVWAGNVKKGEFSYNLLKSKTNGNQLWKFPERTKPVQPHQQSSIQLILPDQPDLGHFLFMPLKTVSKTSQDWYEVISIRKFQYYQGFFFFFFW